MSASAQGGSQGGAGVTRRDVLAAAVVGGVGTAVLAQLASAQAVGGAPMAGGGGAGGGVPIKWLEGVPAQHGVQGVTFGIPWAKGQVAKGTSFSLKGAGGAGVPVQSWPLAYWADGSIKWSGHAVSGGELKDKEFVLMTRAGGIEQNGVRPTVRVQNEADRVVVDTGGVVAMIAKRGEAFLEKLQVGGKDVGTAGRLILLLQDGPSPEDGGVVKKTAFASAIEKVTVEQSGPVRAVVKIEGKHAADGRSVLPFSVRLYFYAGSPQVRVMHSFVYDLDESKDFLAGLGVRFDVPMRDPLYDRHIRFVGEGKGEFGEAIQGLTGLRRNTGQVVKTAQVAGKTVGNPRSWPGEAQQVAGRLAYVPVWGDYTLRQLSADGFDIRKRTKPGHAWIFAGADNRASGTAYVGGVGGGVAFGMRDFWQKHPVQLDIRNAHMEKATATVWMYSPEAPAMDLRFYHDGMGQDTHEKQYDGGLAVTYEDYEGGFGTPNGVARTSEIYLWAVPATPEREALVEFAEGVKAPPLLVSTTEVYHNAKVFGGLWGPVDRSNNSRALVEDRLDFLINFYMGQVEQRHWYGFWDFGDIMHTYDEDRHTWRYDVGGFAWDNSELSPDLWIWYTFLRTGRADVFRFAEAMIRHTSDVDSYHAGPFRLLGTRHGVMHWGDSAKQLRISTAVYRRFFYYLTADERMGDFLHDLREADTTFLTTDPIRKIRKGAYEPQRNALSVGFGTDWGSIAMALLTEWERFGDDKIKTKLLNSMKSIGGMPHGFFSGSGKYDLDTGIFVKEGDGVSMSHLAGAFGLHEACAELIENFDVPEFEKAWIQYAEYYNTPRQQRAKDLGFDEKNQILVQGHARGTAYAAVKKKDKALGRRAWNELITDSVAADAKPAWPPARAKRIEGPDVLKPVDEARLSTNGVAQWGMAAIELMAMVPDAIPELRPENMGGQLGG